MTGLTGTIAVAAPVAPATRFGPAGVARNAGLALALLGASWWLSRDPAGFDRPVTRFVGAHLPGHSVTEVLAFSLANAYTLSGSVFMAVIWCCWSAGSAEVRARLLSGTVAAFLAATAGRGLQHLLHGHLRPLHDPALNFRFSALVDPGVLNGWASFPSDHAAAWFGLATATFIADRRLGLAALAWAAVASASRNALGYHYPTDIAGGAALGALAVWLVQAPALHRVAMAWLARFERRPPLFHAAAFLLSFQIATLFDGVRRVATGIAFVLNLPTF